MNTGGADVGLIVDKGKVCIGSDCRTGWPATYTPTCPSGYADAGDYCIEQNERSPANLCDAKTTLKNSGSQL